MEGLTDTERNGCKNILHMMSKSDIVSLSDTITNKMIGVETISEAVEAILSYTKDAEELLKRKKVYRDVIFKYLAEEGVVMLPNSEKHQLVKRTLELWSSGGKVTVERDSELDLLALSKQFCKWFHELLNSQNPALGQSPKDWGPQHFWPDVRLRLMSRTKNQQMEEDFQGADHVSQRFLALPRDERLFLSPNLEPHGLRSLSSPHGLVVVAVAGTIHRGSVCLGVYEQVFGLIRNPLVNNCWKIKFVNMKIQGQDALGSGEMAPPALTCDSSELQMLCR
ncbi:uncharacterized protein C3orf38 homolog [Aplochiton taeniatus]